jgi:hypothetical protein
VVTRDQTLVIGALEIVPLVCHCLDNHNQLKIIYVVVQFGLREYSQVRIDQAMYTISIILVKNAVDSAAA